MILSVIIVNYRVPYFLELCLQSVGQALQGLDAEIIVVDNDSADGSADFLRPLFPEVKWILNTENTGFSHANNQAFEQSSGEYILFLNPDTILPEDFAQKCLSFFQSLLRQSDPRPGGLGARMIDGSGRFLKESRRGFPSPWVAFCKLSGLTALFPRSPWFSHYYLGYLPPAPAHPASVLSGACFWVSRTALEKAGAFDETFFMYAEDIDLSYRLEKAGYTNYYFPDTTIIHFKGESTPKDIRYTRQFYKAMIQFRRKHFHTGLPPLSRIALETAIWLRAGLSAISIPRPAAAEASAKAATSKPRRTWLTGDPAGIARLQPSLAASSIRTAAPDEFHADEIIYCIGGEFSFKSAIQSLERKSPACTVAFYAAGNHAVISSSRPDDQGEIWIL
jgi:N-acetylglucosaminyl-diphospho-decaprenol L-rhamnosyltransferase